MCIELVFDVLASTRSCSISGKSKERLMIGLRLVAGERGSHAARAIAS
jgi:hypothetical protein